MTGAFLSALCGKSAVFPFQNSKDGVRRNRKKTIFINPGSVGQPRNLNAMAQCAVVDMESEEVVMVKCRYDIGREQEAFPAEIDVFYKDRLEYGI